MSAYTIGDLREILSRTLRDLQDMEKPLDVDRALAIKEISQTIINSAKVEVEHVRVSGGSSTGFLSLPGEVDRDEPASSGQTVSVETKHGVKTIQLRPDGSTVTLHRMR